MKRNILTYKDKKMKSKRLQKKVIGLLPQIFSSRLCESIVAVEVPQNHPLIPFSSTNGMKAYVTLHDSKGILLEGDIFLAYPHNADKVTVCGNTYCLFSDIDVRFVLSQNLVNFTNPKTVQWIEVPMLNKTREKIEELLAQSAKDGLSI